MRQLKIATLKPIEKTFDIEVPNEYNFIKEIARTYATSAEELEILYNAGLQGLAKAKARLDVDRFIRFSIWWVRQEIINCKMK
jgi:DNA-directed RNA polymerase sigma subunit (sigma70/sigma32)